MPKILSIDDVMRDPEAVVEIHQLALALVKKSRQQYGEYDFDYLRELKLALRKAKRAYTKYLQRMNLAWEIVFMGYDEPQPIFDWAKEAIEIGNI